MLILVDFTPFDRANTMANGGGGGGGATGASLLYYLNTLSLTTLFDVSSVPYRLLHLRLL